MIGKTKFTAGLLLVLVACTALSGTALAQTEEVLEQERAEVARYFEQTHDALSEALEMFDDKGNLKDAKDIDAELIEGSKGIFDVKVDDKLFYSKYDTDRFPTNEEILEALA